MGSSPPNMTERAAGPLTGNEHEAQVIKYVPGSNTGNTQTSTERVKQSPGVAFSSPRSSAAVQ